MGAAGCPAGSLAIGRRGVIVAKSVRMYKGDWRRLTGEDIVEEQNPCELEHYRQRGSKVTKLDSATRRIVDQIYFAGFGFMVSI